VANRGVDTTAFPSPKAVGKPCQDVIWAFIEVGASHRTSHMENIVQQRRCLLDELIEKDDAIVDRRAQHARNIRRSRYGFALIAQKVRMGCSKKLRRTTPRAGLDNRGAWASITVSIAFVRRKEPER